MDASTGAIHPNIAVAMDEGSVTVGRLEQLFADEGLEIKRADSQVLILLPLDWVRHHDTSTAQARSPDDRGLPAEGPMALGESGGPTVLGGQPIVSPHFESSEHDIAVMGLSLQFPGSKQAPAQSYRLALKNGLLLTYGQIIALAGDFYGDPDHPICLAGDQGAREAQFQKNFQSLAENPDSVQEVKNILDILHTEFDTVAQAIGQGKQPSAAYGMLGDTLSAKWNVATGGGGSYSSWFPMGRYLRLASTNFDHFGSDAILAYQAGHTLAQRYASQAKTEADLANAYAINAFADHFLTDLFSAGHLRTPRHKMYDDETGPLIPDAYRGAASLLARAMHDEDSKYGLWVTNLRQDRWVMYGDKRYRDAANSQNRAVMRNAVKQSIQEIWDAFNTRHVPAPGTTYVFKYLPRLDVDWTSRDNWSPLFWQDPKTGRVWRRDDEANVAVYSWKPPGDKLNPFRGWWVWSTFTDMWYKGLIQGPPLLPDYISPVTGNPGATGITGFPPGRLQATGPDVVGVPSTTLGPGGPTAYG